MNGTTSPDQDISTLATTGIGRVAWRRLVLHVLKTWVDVERIIGVGRGPCFAFAQLPSRLEFL